ncbi:Hypothetical predicted protein [Olea europaea subsp. europaea]|uniref:Dirigent protein n=2 Tax=Olea europaea subsp. europaea TaxID=158383 RepID=A0A8S0RE41_OLEEU|nr:Hypothetical predicted protein [Olea europaea subsp. europaea]
MLCVLILAMLGGFSNARKVTKLHFYVQDIISGPNQTVWEVARAKITANSPTTFGLVRVVDDLITATADPNSKALGRLQGQVTFADFEESAPLMNLNVVFKAGTYNGSVITMLGRNAVTDKREYAIVGGTGDFRLVKGHAITSTYSVDLATGHVVLEYTLYVVHGKSSTLSDM